MSAVLPIVQLIKTSLLKEGENDTQLTKSIKHKVIDDLQSRYTFTGNVMEILEAAMLLDPRFKTKYLEDDELENVKERIMEEAIHIDITPTVPVPEGREPPSSSAGPPLKKQKSLGTLFKDHEIYDQLADDVMPIISKDQQISNEIQTYIGAARLDFEQNPLLWWKTHGESYPFLKQLARKYLCVCATSAASERLFSTSGNVISSLRVSLKPEKVEMLTFLSKNL